MKKILLLLSLVMAIASFSSVSLAKKTTITVKNETGHTLVAIFGAAGCTGNHKTDFGHSLRTCSAKSLLPKSEKRSYEYGGGTSSRHVNLEIKADMAMYDNEGNYGTPQEYYWSGYIAGHTVMLGSIGTGKRATECFNLYEHGCTKTFGILHDGSITWTKISVKGKAITNTVFQYDVYCTTK